MTTDAEPILEVRDLATSFQTEKGRAEAVAGLNFSVYPGKTLGIVGESGCGKSVTSLSIMRLLPKPAGRIDRGEIVFQGQDLVKVPLNEMHKIRGNRISMIFQEPMTALNPVHKVRKQLGEVFRLHFPEMNAEEVENASIEILRKVQIPAPERRMGEYPHQLSGGMRQRVMIAIAMACKPEVLIADEPTTALDVTVQAQILNLIKDLQEETRMAVIFITHDLGVIAELCDDVLVMYGGRAVEQASVYDLFDKPHHPYTRGLLSSIPRLDTVPKSTLSTIEGAVPGLLDFPKGCRFQNRCPRATDRCLAEPPPQEQVAERHFVRCFHHGDRSHDGANPSNTGPGAGPTSGQESEGPGSQPYKPGT